MGDLLPWYAVRVRSNFESTTSQYLRAKGYEEYSPCYRMKRRWSDRTKVVEVPLFAGYVFCRFDAAKRLPVMQAPGVVAIVSFSSEPAQVDDGEIEAIRLVLGSGREVGPWPYLKDGQKVRLSGGALHGLEGLLLSQKNQYRVVVSVTLLQRSVAVEVDREDVEPVF